MKIYPTLDSTNKEASRLLARGETLHGEGILCYHQEEGRGQYGRLWHSTPGQHLALSVILQPEGMLASELPGLSMKSSLAVVRALKLILPSLNLSIKWPNDIYANHQKLAGILIENALHGTRVEYSIIGIGMNINERSFPDNIPNAISLYILCHKEFDILHVAEVITQQVMNIMEQSQDKWKPEYDALLYGLGEQHSFEVNGSSFTAFIQGVDDNGKLILNTENGIKSFFSHDVTWKMRNTKFPLSSFSKAPGKQ